MILPILYVFLAKVVCANNWQQFSDFVMLRRNLCYINPRLILCQFNCHKRITMIVVHTHRKNTDTTSSVCFPPSAHQKHRGNRETVIHTPLRVFVLLLSIFDNILSSPCMACRLTDWPTTCRPREKPMIRRVAVLLNCPSSN